MQGLGDDRCHHAGIGHWRQIDERHPISEVLRQVLRDGEGQPRLAHPARAGQCQQRHRLVQQKRAGHRTLPLAPDEPGARCRERLR